MCKTIHGDIEKIIIHNLDYFSQCHEKKGIHLRELSNKCKLEFNDALCRGIIQQYRIDIKIILIVLYKLFKKCRGSGNYK